MMKSLANLDYKEEIIMSSDAQLILVTGGAGYIGSHTVVELLNAGYEVVIVDNLSNSCEEAIKRAEEIAGRKVLKFYKTDLTDKEAVKKLFASHKFDAVIHFAGYKAVGESVAKPLAYYENNVAGTVYLLQAMSEVNCKRLVFSSSATVYGDPVSVPVREDFALSATNPYGRTKLQIEDILRDLYKSDNEWSITLLRYFNPVGAHPSGKIGEDPKGIPNNLMPFVSQVAVGKREKLSVFGSDYETKDGTGVRDYIHVVDLAKGHIAALKNLKNGCDPINLGTGNGNSVLEVVRAFEKASGKEVKYELVARRPGDVAAVFADASKAAELLKWKAEFDLDRMCEDSWRWQSGNPDGYC